MKLHASDERGATVDLGGPLLSVSAATPTVIRFSFTASGEWRPRRSWAVTRRIESYPLPTVASAASNGDLVITTDALDVELAGDGRVHVAADGQTVVRDCRPVESEENAPLVTWRQQMPAQRRYYGFGERTGLLEKRGRRYTCWTTDEWAHQGPETDALYVSIPYYLALDPDGSSHGVFLESTFRSAFDLRDVEHEVLSMDVPDTELTWWLIYGPSPAEVVTQLGELLGRPQLPPLWGFGYHQARFSYASESEVLDTARSIRDHEIPADAVHLDIDHMDGYRVFTWDRGRFPDPKRLTSTLCEMGLRTTVVVDAAVKLDPGYAIFDEGRERGYFLQSVGADDGELTGHLWGGVSVYPDFLRADVREWWGAQHNVYADVGVAGFLDDMNEPGMRDRPIEDENTQNTEPDPDTLFGGANERATHREARNVYGSCQNRALRDWLNDERPNSRRFILTRSGFAGMQRDAIVWTGDNSSFWEHLEMSLPQLMNLGLSGVSFAGADIGGFFESCDPELLVRWTQLGALYPFARNNSARDTARQEPWAFGEPTLSRCRRAIELRYRLLPYLYGVASEATRTGLPWLRPLFIHYPDVATAVAVEDEALIGADLLLAPVMRPGKLARSVYLPPGDWCDLRTFEWHSGGSWILGSAGLDMDVPIYARGGSIIPMSPVRQWTTQEPNVPLPLHVFPGWDGDARGSMYEDDGESMDYERGGFRLTTYTATARPDGSAELSGTVAEGDYQPPDREVEVIVHAR